MRVMGEKVIVRMNKRTLNRERKRERERVNGGSKVKDLIVWLSASPLSSFFSPWDTKTGKELLQCSSTSFHFF